MAEGNGTLLVVGIGDIHGRFHRVQGWLAALEEALGREADLVFAVGDVEAFLCAEDHRRKAAKRAMPAEFADYAEGRATLRHPFWFIGGNNEDFETLHPIPDGGELPGGCHYLGRAGVRRMEGLTVAYLSGITAPTQFERPLEAPSTAATRKQAGYFRKPEVVRLVSEASQVEVDLLLVHEWPKGIVRRSKGRALRAYRFPWIGSPVTREVLEHLRPSWLWAGHSHVPYATTFHHTGGAVTRICCLDQATRPEASIFWLELEGREAVRAGWGIRGEVAWRRGEPWEDDRTPEVGPSDDDPDDPPVV